MHGTLNVARIEGLLRMAVCVEGSEAAHTLIQDAISSFPDDGFLEPVIGKLKALGNKTTHQHTRGLMCELTRITTELEEVQTATRQSAEYGRKLLETAESLIYVL